MIVQPETSARFLILRRHSLTPGSKCGRLLRPTDGLRRRSTADGMNVLSNCSDQVLSVVRKPGDPVPSSMLVMMPRISVGISLCWNALAIAMAPTLVW